MTFKDIAIAAFVQALWGVGFTLCKPAMDAFPPLMATTIIYIIIVIVLTPFSRKLKTPIGWTILISALGGSIQTSLILFGLHLLPASLANLLLQLTVPFAVIISWVFRDEKPSTHGIAGCVIALLGVAIVIGLPEGGASWLGIGLMVGGALSWAVAQNLIRHHSVDDGLSFYANMARWSVPQMAAATLLLESDHASYLAAATWGDWTLIVVLAITGFAGGYALWYRLLFRNRVDQLLPFGLLMAPIGVAASVIFLGEDLQLSLILGGSIILVGLWIINWRRKTA